MHHTSWLSLLLRRFLVGTTLAVAAAGLTVVPAQSASATPSVSSGGCTSLEWALDPVGCSIRELVASPTSPLPPPVVAPPITLPPVFVSPNPTLPTTPICSIIDCTKLTPVKPPVQVAGPKDTTAPTYTVTFGALKAKKLRRGVRVNFTSNEAASASATLQVAGVTAANATVNFTSPGAHQVTFPVSKPIKRLIRRGATLTVTITGPDRAGNNGQARASARVVR